MTNSYNWNSAIVSIPETGTYDVVALVSGPEGQVLSQTWFSGQAFTEIETARAFMARILPMISNTAWEKAQLDHPGSSDSPLISRAQSYSAHLEDELVSLKAEALRVYSPDDIDLFPRVIPCPLDAPLSILPKLGEILDD